MFSCVIPGRETPIYREKVTWAINFTFLYLKKDVWYQLAVFFKRKFIYLANGCYKLILKFLPDHTIFGHRGYLGRKLLLVPNWWKCMYKILPNVLFLEKRILNIRKMITKDNKSYIRRYEGIMLGGERFLGSNGGQKCPNIAHFRTNDNWKLQSRTHMLFHIKNSMVLSDFEKNQYLTYFWATQGVKWGSKVPKYCPFPHKWWLEAADLHTYVIQHNEFDGAIRIWHNSIFDLFWATQGVKWGSKVPKYCPFPRKWWLEAVDLHTYVIPHKELDGAIRFWQNPIFDLFSGHPRGQMGVKSAHILPISSQMMIGSCRFARTCYSA